jgi:hypothetical protein
MKRNVVWAAVILVGMLCAWNYLAAKPVPEDKASPQSNLLEIKEPSQEDFEHCAKRAMDFFESMRGVDQSQMEKPLADLLPEQETGDNIPGMSAVAYQLGLALKETKVGKLELMAKKSFGENMVVLFYHYQTDKNPLFSRFVFVRLMDSNGEPGQWECRRFHFDSSFETVVSPWM